MAALSRRSWHITTGIVQSLRTNLSSQSAGSSYYPEHEGRYCSETLIRIYQSTPVQWLRGLGRRSAAARLLRLWIRIPPGVCLVGRDSSAGITTHYGLDGPGIESRWGRDFPQPSRPALGPTKSPIQLVPAVSRGLSRHGVALTIHLI